MVQLKKCGTFCFLIVMSVCTSMYSDETGTKPEAKLAAISALKDYNTLIGNWRGIGQPKRGSQQGAWQEKAEAVWELKPTGTGIRWKIDSNKMWKAALLGYDEKSKMFSLKATLTDETERTHTGKVEDKRLVLESAPDEKTGEIHRVTLTMLSENRMTLLFEKRPEKQSFFTRVAEVAYQRDGTKLAAAGGNGPICVVTGGTGTIPVMHKGKTYYVCCTGCRDAFNDDPEGVLAEYDRSRTKPAK